MANPNLKTLQIDDVARDVDRLNHILDGEANGSLRSSTSAVETPAYELGKGAVTLGNGTVARAWYSQAQNEGTVTAGYAQTAIGQYNIAQGGPEAYVATDHAFIIGNGMNGNERSNAMYVQWNGKEWLADTLEVSRDPSANMEVATRQYADRVKVRAALLNGTQVQANTDATFTLYEPLSNFDFIEIGLYTSKEANRKLLARVQFETPVNGVLLPQYHPVFFQDTQYMLKTTVLSDTSVRVWHNATPSQISVFFSLAGHYRVASQGVVQGANSIQGVNSIQSTARLAESIESAYDFGDYTE